MREVDVALAGARKTARFLRSLATSGAVSREVGDVYKSNADVIDDLADRLAATTPPDGGEAGR